MCGPFLQAVKEHAKKGKGLVAFIQPIGREPPTPTPKRSVMPDANAIYQIYPPPPGTKRWKNEYFATPKDLGKALNDSVKAHTDLHTEHHTESGIVLCNGCCAKPVVLTPNPKDVQREYDSLRVIDPRVELIDSKAINRALKRILNMVIRDKLIEMGYKGDEAKVVLNPVEPPYVHRFGTPKERKAIERMVNAEIDEQARAWKALRDYEDSAITLSEYNPRLWLTKRRTVTKRPNRLSGEITPAPNQGIRETSPDFRAKKARARRAE